MTSPTNASLGAVWGEMVQGSRTRHPQSSSRGEATSWEQRTRMMGAPPSVLGAPWPHLTAGPQHWPHAHVGLSQGAPQTSPQRLGPFPGDPRVGMVPPSEPQPTERGPRRGLGCTGPLWPSRSAQGWWQAEAPCPTAAQGPGQRRSPGSGVCSTQPAARGQSGLVASCPQLCGLCLFAHSLDTNPQGQAVSWRVPCLPLRQPKPESDRVC